MDGWWLRALATVCFVATSCMLGWHLEAIGCEEQHCRHCLPQVVGYYLWGAVLASLVGDGLGGGGGAGRCFNFIPARGDPPPGTTSLPPLDPIPPSPLHSNSPENQGFGNVFSFGPKFSSRAFGALIAGFFGHSTVSFVPSFANTMSQRPISAFFGSPVQPCPRVKRNDVVNTILYFHFQDRWIGKKRQEAH